MGQGEGADKLEGGGGGESWDGGRGVGVEEVYREDSRSPTSLQFPRSAFSSALIVCSCLQLFGSRGDLLTLKSPPLALVWGFACSYLVSFGSACLGLCEFGFV